MGILKKAARRSVPRSVRKPYRAVRHPIRTAVPSPMKSLSRGGYNVTNPANALGNAAEDAMLGLVSAPHSRGAGHSQGSARPGSPSAGQAASNEDARLDEAERQLRREHLITVVPVSPAQPNPIAYPDQSAALWAADADLGVTALAQEIGKFGDPPTAPAPQAVDPTPMARAIYDRAAQDPAVRNMTTPEAVWARAWQEAQAQADANLAEQTRYRAEVTEWIAVSVADLTQRHAEMTERVSHWVTHEMAMRQAAFQQQSERIQRDWSLLLANDPVRTAESVGTQLSRHAVAAYVVEVDADEIILGMPVGQLDDCVLLTEPAWTPGGRPTRRKRTKTRRNELYRAVIASSTLATAQVAFAAAPGAEAVKCVALIDRGGSSPAPVCAASFSRPTLEAIRSAGMWTDEVDDLCNALEFADGLRLVTSGRARDVQVLPLED